MEKKELEKIVSAIDDVNSNVGWVRRDTDDLNGKLDRIIQLLETLVEQSE